MNDVNYLKNNGVDVDKSLELFGDLETYNSSLLDFINDVSEKIDKLRSFKEIGDMTNYSIDVHSIKSDAKYFGFNKLADIALDHEIKSKENNMFYISQHYDELEQEMNNALRIVKVYLGDESIDDFKEIKQEINTPKEKTILIVDDSEVIKNFIEKLFNNEYEILVASDGMEAINIIREGKYNNLVGMFLDLNMPNVNGFQVLDFFKENNLFEKIPVSIITGVGSDDLVAKAYQYPIIDVLRKPFNEKNIRFVVNKTVNKKFENFE